MQFKAFSFLEVMITMVLSSILIFAALESFLLLEKMINAKNKQMNCGKEAIQLYQALSHDFDNASIIESNNMLVSMMEPDKQLIQYELGSAFVVRTVKYLTDTFWVNTSNLKITKEVTTGYTNTLKMDISGCNEEYPVFLVKEYSNDVLMNRN
jgi:type II secretory pathway component PulJ